MRQRRKAACCAALFILFFPLMVMAQSIDLTLENVTVKNAMETLKKNYGYSFVFESGDVNTQKVITLQLRGQSVAEAARRILQGQNVSFEIKDKNIVVQRRMPPQSQQTQPHTVTGKVTDQTGEPLIGAAVMVKGTNTGTVTNTDGQYSIEVAGAGPVLSISYIGYLTEEVAVADRSVANVTLKESTNLMQEVVVTAYGRQTRESITGAVSTVRTSDIEQRSLSNIANVLDGKTTGVIFQNSGQPGSSPTIRIRGIGSITGSNSPLYVVDGAIMSGDINDLNPQDIDNISILKDAASAALYGNRAANGVVIITTKRGKSTNEKFVMRANASTGIYSRGVPEYDVLGADDWMEVQWLGLRNQLLTDPANAGKYTTTTANAKATADLVGSYLNYNIYDKPADQLFDANGKLIAGIRPEYTDLNWWDYVQRTGIRQDYTLSGSGHTEKSNFYFSMGYMNDRTYVKTAGYDRLTARASLDFTPRKWFTAGITINGSYQNFNNTNTGGGSMSNPFYTARNMAPIYPVFQHNPNTGEFLLDSNGDRMYDTGDTGNNVAGDRPQYRGSHTVYEMLLNERNTLRTTLGGNAYASIKFLKDFTFTVRGDVGLNNTEARVYYNAIVGDGKSSNGTIDRTVTRDLNYTAQELLNYTHAFGLHHVDVLAGHENSSIEANVFAGAKYTQVLSTTHELSNFTNMEEINSYKNVTRTDSWLARGRYNYDEKYFFDASVRRDASSKFYRDTRWGTFFSLGGSWSIHREAFMEPYTNTLNSLKLRASYGQVGNDASAGRYAWMDMYSMEQLANKGAAYKSQNAAYDLEWESVNSWNIGVDARLFDRLNISVEWYNKTSDGLIFSVYNPSSAGNTTSSASTTMMNLGDMRNTGFEIGADIDAIRTRDWRWNISFNGSTLANKVLTLPEQNREEGIISGNKKIVEGRSMYSWYLYQYAGLDRYQGVPLYYIDDSQYYVAHEGVTAPEGKTAIPEGSYVTIDGKDYTTNASAYGKKDWSGTALPSFYGSIGTDLQWKNLSFSLLCTYSIGGKILDDNYNTLTTTPTTPNALSKDVLSYWKEVPEGMTADSPDRIDPNGRAINWYRPTGYTASNNAYLHSASYFSIRNISVAYSLPRQLTDKLDINGLQVRLSAENLYMFTSLKGMNPQQSVDGTQAKVINFNRTVSLGLNLTF